MPLPRGYQFYVCPDCLKRGVYLYNVWKCRYCDFFAYSTGNDKVDMTARQRLRSVNWDRLKDQISPTGRE